jgi:predicted XRE-type DNA-binding protein
MPKKNKTTDIEYEEGSGNVFADLGLEEADELFTRSQIGFHVYTLLKRRKLKQREMAKLLGVAQPDVSHLMNGHYSRFTADKLLDFLRRLDQKVIIRIRPHRRGEPYQEVSFAA